MARRLIGVGAALALAGLAAAAAAQSPTGQTPSEAPAAKRAPVFEEATGAAGLDFRYDNGAVGELWFAEMMGGGGALFDFDGDDDLDLYLIQGGPLAPAVRAGEAPLPTDRLYRNDLDRSAPGGPRVRFTDVTARAGIDAGSYGMGVAAGDFDNDGRVDLYVATLGRDRLLRNRGDGTFEDVTEKAGLAGDTRWSVGAAVLDYDRDGWLDLYVIYYVDFTVTRHKFCPNPLGANDYCGPQAYRPETDRLLRNRGDGTFEDVTEKAGLTAAAGVPPAPGLGAVAADFDGNGWPDLYVANDQTANYLLLNQGDGTFVDEALLAGCAVNAEGVREASMGIEAADFDGDGSLDLFLTHFKNQTNTLYLNDGRGLFRDATAASGLGTPSWASTGFGTAAVDFENDGDLDLAIANGAVTLFSVQGQGGESGLGQRDQLFRNVGGGRFTELTDDGAFTERVEAGRGVASGDVDDDGDLDLVVVGNDGPVRLWLNRGADGGGWIGARAVVRPGGPEGPARDALGAVVVRLEDGRPVAVRRAATDGSYAAARDPRVLFGLGDKAPATVDLRVIWPDGASEDFPGRPSGEYSVLERGKGRRAATPEDG